MQTKEVNGERYLSAMGTIRDIHEPGSMKLFAGNEGVDAAQSVKEYAVSKGFDRVVRVALGTFIKNADYELLEDGSLRMIVQMEYNYNFKENHPKFMVRAWIPLQVIAFDEEGFRENIRQTVQATKGCRVEYIIRDILTINGNVHKVKRAVEIIREETENSYR